ncbi:G_PROTEIN_RECEP_F1_2 domain-containing protein [Caenorhabditis elegans]|uniref:G_PROTEIN_RECEP_F1_2 domain-containing protein n=1 Tax=Caenorhabditis elegans TaxID=6239 RepID=Q7K712_CAEEL|nr:G_PROTEIN_RECEP_F1_2 domain-containing protein [Caenorhabditis elegans]CAB60365.1 G_PROTEIN_RECEP_F1_2 domain-containing protein [Caenorhabditis elegans]|eukprot:NP_496727.1 Uncharacterized protein CELE_Y46G5A.22 [Caenorhabditis elegans]
MRKSTTRRSHSEKSSSRGSMSSPPTRFYPSEDSESIYSTRKCSKRTTTTATTDEEKPNNSYYIDDIYDSTEEYQVTFPTVELKLPRQRKHCRRRSKRQDQAQGEHVTITKCVDRRQVYGEPDNKNTISEHSTYTYSTHPERCSQAGRTSRSNSYSDATDATYRTENSQNRLQTLGNCATSIGNFFRNNPRFTKLVFGIILCYLVVCNLEILIPRVIALVVRLSYPWARYWAVVVEQFFMSIANMFTRMDAIIFFTSRPPTVSLLPDTAVRAV